MKQNQTIIKVELKRGLIVSLASNKPNTKVIVVDHDNQDAPSPNVDHYSLETRLKRKGPFKYMWE